MSKVSFMTCFIKVKISSAVGSLLFFSNLLKNSSHFWLYSLDFSAVSTVAGRPWQVNKIIGCLQVFQGILFLPSVACTVVSRLLLLAVVKMTSPWFMSCWNAVKHLVLSASYEIFLPSVARFACATSPHLVSGGAFSIP